MIKTFKSRDKLWIDESGVEIPYNRTTVSERIRERSSAKLIKEAMAINTRLKAFKEMVKKLSQQAYDAYMLEKNVQKQTKGNYTWFNFNRSIKIEVNVNEPIVFDSLTITAAKSKFDLFLDKNISSKNQFAKEMVLGAFETQRSGDLDTKRVMGLTRYTSKVNDPLFTEAVDLVMQAIRRPATKIYFRVWKKDASGKYENIDLNLSSL